MAGAQRTKYGTGREALIEAAVRVVSRNGLHGMTFRKVAAEAGVNNSLVAHHFGSLAVLASAALEWSFTTALRDTHLTAFRQSDSEYKEALGATLSEEFDVHVYQFEMVLEASRDPELKSQIREMYGLYTREIGRSLFGTDASPQQVATARAVFAALDGLVLQYVGGAIDRTELDDAVSALWKLTESAISLKS